ncbi:MAG: AMIN-like domain-containing (lipo)protein [Corynebacterium casei]|uniref:AMIN-like domain-containing protein n=2 Tax=Corynebacterium casei TaxID=160386 RepID=G7HVH4_9CORY|nr:hypothetical protein [Corynebacterium casei]MDN5740817.1 hypothetical protein [Corynebacterium casei]MDN5883581.1 hypothetical protein [Corynebacterium casei]MDN5902819.1 hypothetical protein [Corynebacterium casei]MDN6130820.1 hypothetical protein [Corynebacterium casei]MDN6628667.1 hypothetical protein [Corynebacterium casei]
MSIRRISLSALGLVTATTLLAACSSPADETAASSISPATSEESTSDTAASETTSEEQTSPTPSTVEATADGSQAITPLGSPDVTDKQARPSEGTSLIPKGVRVADHGAFTRVVLDYEGEGKAGWYTQLTAEPAQQASGFPIEYDGATAIVIGVESTPWPSTPELEEAYMDSGKVEGTAAGVVTGVEYVNTFEAQSQYVIGLNKESAYSVTSLEGPPRVVIDILN